MTRLPLMHSLIMSLALLPPLPEPRPRRSREEEEGGDRLVDAIGLGHAEVLTVDGLTSHGLAVPHLPERDRMRVEPIHLQPFREPGPPSPPPPIQDLFGHAGPPPPRPHRADPDRKAKRKAQAKARRKGRGR